MKARYTLDPSHADVELALKALEIEDEREKEAIRRFYARERQGIKFHWWKVLWFCLKVGFWAAVTYALLWLWPIAQRLP